MRRIAVHELQAEKQTLSQAIIELTDGHVTDYYPFTDELPQTEWIGGTVILRRNKQGLIQAFKNNRLLC